MSATEPQQVRLQGKVALVTGAASGIGEACARRFAAEGATVIVSDVRADLGEAVVRDIGAEASFAALDVTDLAQWDAAMSVIQRRHGGLDVLVNNAGAGTGGGIERETLEGHRRVLEINVTGVWAGIRVNSVHPGIIETPMVAKNTGASMQRLRNAVARQPIKRMGRSEEIASAVLFFASDESSYCTGASLVVDGGHIAGPFRDPM